MFAVLGLRDFASLIVHTALRILDAHPATLSHSTSTTTPKHASAHAVYDAAAAAAAASLLDAAIGALLTVARGMGADAAALVPIVDAALARTAARGLEDAANHAHHANAHGHGSANNSAHNGNSFLNLFGGGGGNFHGGSNTSGRFSTIASVNAQQHGEQLMTLQSLNEAVRAAGRHPLLADNGGDGANANAANHVDTELGSDGHAASNGAQPNAGYNGYDGYDGAYDGNCLNGCFNSSMFSTFNEMDAPPLSVSPDTSDNDEGLYDELLGGADAAAGAHAIAEGVSGTSGVSMHRLKKAWEDAKQQHTRDDWHDWLRRLSLEMLRESPSQALRACTAVAQAFPPLAHELFHAAFLSCWSELPEGTGFQDSLVASLETAFDAEYMSPEARKASARARFPYKDVARARACRRFL
eukprot:6204750-Pleurochrysis_carterae.AAC.2